MGDREHLRKLATTLRDAHGLKGRWRWSGWIGQELHLQTSGHGGMYVMGFARYGMQYAQPVFPHIPDGERTGWLHKAMTLARFEVCHEATSADDPRVYRGTIDGIKNPVAEYLAAVDAETVIGLLDEIDRLREVAEELWNMADDHGAGICSDEGDETGNCRTDMARLRDALWPVVADAETPPASGVQDVPVAGGVL